jgi:hypothetical protein
LFRTSHIALSSLLVHGSPHCKLGGLDEEGEPYSTSAQELTYCVDLSAVGVSKNQFEVEQVQQLIEVLKNYFGQIVSLSTD